MFLLLFTSIKNLAFDNNFHVSYDLDGMITIDLPFELIIRGICIFVSKVI